ncbi:MAG: GTPase domain-containing protein [Promethearchaeota archaeon]
MDSFIDIDHNLAILGTDDGQLIRIINSQQELIFTDNYTSEVRSIRKINSNTLVIAFMSGNIILLENYINNYSTKLIRNGENTKYTRIYALEVYDENTLYFSSNYGKIYKMVQVYSNWVSILIKKFHETNAIFCLDKLKPNLFVTCDYNGGVAIWEVKNRQEFLIDKINTLGNIQCVACSNDLNSLAMVHRSGTFLIFQKSEGKYNLILENDYPSYLGKKIIYMEEDNSFIFNTKRNLYKYVEGNLFEYNFSFTGNLEKNFNQIFILNPDKEIQVINKNDFNSVGKFKISKLLNVGLIGHTGVGKSTLCDKYGDIEKRSDLSSTSHRKLWIYRNEANGKDRYIFFNDIAGQLELIPTLLPSLLRSDIILALFKSNDSSTLDILKKYVRILRENYNYKKDIILIRTHYNKKRLESSHSDLIDDDVINEFIEKFDIKIYVSIDRDDFDSLKNFKEKFHNSINWDNIRDWPLSIQQEIFLNFLKFYLEKDLQITSLSEIIRTYDEMDVKQREILAKVESFYGFERFAIRALLLKYKEKDLIDVLKSDEDLIVILNSALFRKIKSHIYKNAKRNMGLVNLEEISEFFKDKLDQYEDKMLFKKYLSYYDKEFKESNTWLTNEGNQRIFWSLIENESFSNANKIVKELRSLSEGLLEQFDIDLGLEIDLPTKKDIICNLELFLEFIKLKLIAIKLSKTRGYWRNKENTLRLYYRFYDGEESTHFNYYIYSKQENHESALLLDTIFRSHFLINEEISYDSTRNSDFYINPNIYIPYIKLKKDFLNLNTIPLTIKYERSTELDKSRKILFLYSIPINKLPLRSEIEMLKIKELLLEIDYNSNNYIFIPHCSILDLENCIKEFNPDFLYYTGHSEEYLIFLENAKGLAESIDGKDFIDLIDNSNISEVYLNSCSSKYILELTEKTSLKYIGYNQPINDIYARDLGYAFLIFLIRYEMDFKNALKRSKSFVEKQKGITINFIESSEL